MVKSSLKYIKKLKSLGFDKVIFHFGTEDPVKVIAEAKKLKLKTFIAINPEVRVDEVCYLFDLVDGVLVMGVHPGKEHQSLMNSTYKKIKEIRKCNKNIIIQVDGGVNDKTAGKLVKSGANILNTGSFVSNSENPKKALKELKTNL